eukprot:4171976-Pyramimonas_sp.AAC.1
MMRRGKCCEGAGGGMLHGVMRPAKCLRNHGIYIETVRLIETLAETFRFLKHRLGCRVHRAGGSGASGV